jgi:hypothetical protein
MGHSTPGQHDAATRTWDSLTYSEAHGMRFFLNHDQELGREARRIAGGDHDLALWLVDAGNAFADQTKTFPHDLSHPCWREWRTAGLTPQAAARVALHLKPMVQIADDHLICPVCGAVDQIAERDVAVRLNPLHVSDGTIHGSTESCDHEHDRYVCQHCGIDVRLPNLVDW